MGQFSSPLSTFLKIYFYVHGCSAWLVALYACLVLRKGKEGVRSLGIGVRDGCELSCVCLELYLTPMENNLRPETAEPTLQPTKHSVPKNNQHSYTYSSLYHNDVKIVS